MVKYRLGFVDKKIPARKCQLKLIDKKQGKEFFLKNHIDGNNNGKTYYRFNL